MALPTLKLDSIQSVRAIAAAAVALFHIKNGQELVDAGHMLFANFDGSWGVDLFFVISGFIMVYINRDTASGPAIAGRFLYRRVIRIVPLYWFYTLLIIALYIAFNRDIPDVDRVVKSLLFIPDGFPVLMVGWTLNYEMYFYLVFTITLLLPRHWRLLALTIWLAGTCLAGFLANPFQVYWSFKDITFYTNPIVLEFLAGVFVGYIYLQQRFLSRQTALLFVLTGFPAIFIARYFISDIETWRFLAWGIPSVMIVYGFLSLEFHKAKGTAALAHLGDSSYSLYLCHLIVTGLISVVWSSFGWQGYFSNIGYLVITTAVVFAVAELSFRFIEQPAYNRLKGLL